MLSREVLSILSSMHVCSSAESSFLMLRSLALPCSLPASTSRKIFFRCLSTQDLDRNKDAAVKQKSSGGQKRWTRTKTYLKHYFNLVFKPSGKNAFGSSDIGIRYILDKLPSKDWCLIYDDPMASISHIVGALGIPFISISLVMMGIDGWQTNCDFTIQAYGVIFDGLYDVGYLAVFPLTFMVMIGMIAVRTQQLRLFKVYQNRHNPNQFKFDVDRSQIKCVPETIFGHNAILKLLLLGHIQVGGRRLLINESNFLANNYCSYMLGQSKIVPKNLQSAALQSNDDSDNARLDELFAEKKKNQ